MAGIRAYGQIAYGPSKAALIDLTREIAVLHGRQGIRVNSVSPGHMATPFVAEHLDPEMRRLRRDIGLLGIEGDASDVASAVAFLASDDARFITATDLAVDGGVSATGSLVAHALVAKA
jgi:NAD(P)-dependent dehydrogenase (short-subunit alcohol dehydrogenase family)